MSRNPVQILRAVNPLAPTPRTPRRLHRLAVVVGIRHPQDEDRLYLCGGERRRCKTRAILARALAAYSHALARQPRADLPLNDLPSWTFKETITERTYVAVCSSSRPLAVYRVKPGGCLSQLKRWPQALDRRLEYHGPPLATTSVRGVSRGRAPPVCPTTCWYDLCSGRGKAPAHEPTAAIVGLVAQRPVL
jgi:hypothetical protein